MENVCFLNGEYVPRDKASFRIDDIGLLRGFGFFEFLEAHFDKPFLLEGHLERLFNSAKLLNISIPYSRKELSLVVSTLLKMHSFGEAKIRILITGGLSPDSVTYFDGKAEIFITVDPLTLLNTALYSSGVGLITLEHRRELPEVKTLNYIHFMIDSKRRKKLDAFNTLYVYRNEVLEAATANFFMIKNETIVTAKTGILLGLTRNAVLNVAKNIFPVKVRRIDCSELKESSEMFITSTGIGILPVTRVDGKKVGSGVVGPVTKRLIREYANYVNNYYKFANG